MTKEFEVNLSQFNHYQRKGIDQTANYRALFEGNSKLANLAKVDAVKEQVQNGAFYLSRLKSETADDYLVIEMYNKGNVYKINSRLYTVKVVNDNILAIDKHTSEETFLIVDGELEFGKVKHLGVDNYTYMSSNQGFKGIPALRINNSYKDSIRIHWIIALMRYGIEELSKCVGDSPTNRLRHKQSYRKSRDNSISNLEIKIGTDNYKGENY